MKMNKVAVRWLENAWLVGGIKNNLAGLGYEV